MSYSNVSEKYQSVQQHNGMTPSDACACITRRRWQRRWISENGGAWL